MESAESTLRLAEHDDAEPPPALGRFGLVRQLGRGAMGIVVEAHDPSLDRRVAIKILHQQVWTDAARERARIEREAQAMARLSHPNVVVVYEVGWLGDRAFLAMELVDGGTLRDWQRAAPRSWRDLVAMYVAAGRGLAAAHAEGLAHRDFKPDNVLVGRDGRPRVTDFGLATERTAIGPDFGHADITSSVSIAGRAIGTPAYMAPECWRGEDSDARTDQFAFCASLWEALAGKRPFGGSELGALRAAILEGAFDPAARLEVPRRLEQALRRGLAVRATERWPSLTELLDELAVLAAPRSRWPWLVAGGGVVVAVGAIAAIASSSSSGAAPVVAPVVAPPVVAPVVATVPSDAPAQAITKLGGCAFMPAFLDDRTVAFDRAANGAWDLYAITLGGEPRQLTTDRGGEWGAVRGPAGRIGFAVQSPAEKPHVDELDPTTGVRSKLYDGAGYLTFAKDAYYIARNGTGEIVRIQGARQEIFARIEGVGPAVNLAASPDGARLAAFGYEKGMSTLCFVETATAVVTCRPELTSGDKLQRPLPLRPAFSADGRSLYYTGPRAIFRVPVEGGPPTSVRTASTRGGLAISPSGDALVMSMCMAHSSFTALGGALPAELAALREVDWPAVSPNGAVAYISNQRKIAVREASGTVREVVVLTDGSATELTMTPDGQRLVYQVAGGANAGIFEVSLETGLPNRISAKATDRDPVFATGAKGDAIVFTRTVDATPRLAWIALAGGGEHEFPDKPRIALAAHPDGRILTTTPARDHFYWWDRIADTEQPGPPLVLEKAIKSVRISPDGRWLVARAGANGFRIYRLALDRPTATAELVRELPSDLSSLSVTIDNAGHIIATLNRSEGELELVRAPPGSRW